MRSPAVLLENAGSLTMAVSPSFRGRVPQWGEHDGRVVLERSQSAAPARCVPAQSQLAAPNCTQPGTKPKQRTHSFGDFDDLPPRGTALSENRDRLFPLPRTQY